MDELGKPALIRYLPQVTIATLLVAVCPAVAVWEVNSAGWVTSVTLSGALGLALALGASFVGRLYWSSRPGSGDLLFSELMLWGWLRRLWIERRLDKALRLLESDEAQAELGSDRRAELLTQLAAALEARDPYTSGHSHRVARHAATIAKRMGLSRHDVADVRVAALVHDVGKLSTPNAVLRKPGDLTADEFAVIKEHPERGAEMVSKLGNDRLTGMVLHHHERLDGSGYPTGLVGGEIPLGARIIAVADTFDAVTSSRPYRPARSHRAAITILHEQAGSRLDPAAVRAFDSHYSGRRPLAVWVALSNVPARLVSWLGGGATAAAGSAVRTVATAAVTGAAAVTAVAGYQHRPPSAFETGHGTVEVASLAGGPGASGSSAAPVAVTANTIVSASAIAQVDFRTASVLGASTTQDLSQTAASPSLVDVVGSLTGSPLRGQVQLPPTGVSRGTSGGAVTGGLPGRETAGAPVDPGSLGATTTGQTQTVGDNSQTTNGSGRGGDGTTTGTDSAGSGSTNAGSSTSWDSPSSTSLSSSGDTTGSTGTSGGADAIVAQAPTDTTPAAPTDTQTQPPADTTQTATDAQTLPPVDTTQTSADTQTQPPADTTQTPADTTQTPADTTQPPADTTQAPADTTQTPADTTQTPADTTQTPADTTQAPTDTPSDTTQTPADATPSPTDAPADTPADTTQAPADTQATDGTQATDSGTDGQGTADQQATSGTP